MEGKKMVAYKGFNKDMTCRDFQYEEGQTYECEKAKLCNVGFHACENPIDILKYYNPNSSVYHKVELEGISEERNDDSKVCAKKITIGAKLSIKDICTLTFEYVKSKCTNENNSETGKPATAGDSGAATAGKYGAATAGNYGAATAGDSGAATAGDSGAATAGYSGAATAGYRGAATSRGSSSSGVNGLSVARGKNVRVKGGIGAYLAIAEEDYNYGIKFFATAIVGKDGIKPYTWYKLDENGKLVEDNNQN